MQPSGGCRLQEPVAALVLNPLQGCFSRCFSDVWLTTSRLGWDRSSPWIHRVEIEFTQIVEIEVHIEAIIIIILQSLLHSWRPRDWDLGHLPPTKNSEKHPPSKNFRQKGYVYDINQVKSDTHIIRWKDVSVTLVSLNIQRPKKMSTPLPKPWCFWSLEYTKKSFGGIPNSSSIILMPRLTTWAPFFFAQ